VRREIDRDAAGARAQIEHRPALGVCELAPER
jgi:hypothetical protein